MTVITDVPDSGVYIQRGAIFQIVAQLLDYATGEPIQLQTASGLSISILYPDLVTTQTFAAQLYTDGSDGMIVYTTQNDGATIDLSQVGLYKFQGNAVVGGINLPPSYESDFYVLPNVIGGPAMNIVTPTAVIMFDGANVRWAGMVNPSGALSFAALISGPTTFLQLNNLVMKDSNGVYHQFSISTLGVVSSVPGGSFADSIDFFTIADINNKTWIVKCTTAGALLPQ